MPLSAAYPPEFDLRGRLLALYRSDAHFEVAEDAVGQSITAWLVDWPVPSDEQLRAVVLPEPDLTITDLQARLWLNAAGLYEAAIQAHIGAIPDLAARENARAVWDRALTVHLSHPLTQSLGAALGLNAAQLRAAFVTAATL